MGVNACDRNGCENILCEKCILGSWYICWSCEAEFKDLIGSDLLSRTEMLIKFKEFLNTSVLTQDHTLETVDDFIESNGYYNNRS